VGLIIRFVFDILQVPGGCIQICSGSIAPALAPWHLGLHEIIQSGKSAYSYIRTAITFVVRTLEYLPGRSAFDRCQQVKPCPYDHMFFHALLHNFIHFYYFSFLMKDIDIRWWGTLGSRTNLFVFHVVCWLHLLLCIIS
jgi:hypothetical protein